MKTKKRVLITINKDLHGWYKDHYVEDRGKSFSSLINDLLFEHSSSLKNKENILK